eukprot:gene18881-25439_t
MQDVCCQTDFGVTEEEDVYCRNDSGAGKGDARVQDAGKARDQEDKLAKVKQATTPQVAGRPATSRSAEAHEQAIKITELSRLHSFKELGLSALDAIQIQISEASKDEDIEFRALTCFDECLYSIKLILLS